MIIIIAIIKLIVILCVVATIHEFGHFIAAKLLKVGVNEFSIGFGPKIVQKKFKETMYTLRWIPLGGYVMIEGEGEESNKSNSYSNKNALSKIIVLVMGVVFNILLAFIILMSISFSVPTYTTEIKEFTSNSVLEKAGLLAGDKITKINGDRTTLAQDLMNTNYTDSDVTKIEYIRDGIIKEVEFTNAVKDIGYIGASFVSDDTKGTNKIDTVRAGKQAEKTGIKSGDIITQINGNTVNNATDIINLIKQNANNEMIIVIDRNGENLTKSLTPDAQKQFDLGIYDTKSVNTTLVYAFDKSIKIISTVVNSYVDLFKGKVMLDDVSSIVGIGVVVSKTTGILEYLNILAIISLAIGIANLLPFPPLDGGKILFVLIGSIIRRKIPVQFEAFVSFVGFGALILLTIVVTYKDIVRIF
ncbi:MAG: RIP metalloprotease RseP [Clostridia bacterium]|nr:RIP metalloprotease RseP [Clostridia bacterium]MDD4386224.1 RIP metalloprotease RseP [Clostridia bacterium]